ncbi:FeoA family protein [Clostridium tetani]|uniref:FeoA family protein n=1 Tax=Clostridium tetani TaxID=1513 RepID=UPI0003C0D8E9|nr:FeoA family protein [Clostridium tetani]RXI40901.1 ferrous iron transport protein A [Clostridium tetani]CDI48518.1 Fe2+ transport system protein A [Clostridium tetani 12124569]
MENTLLPLNKAPIGSIVSVMELISDGISRRRMLDLGLIQGTKIQCLRQSPLGDPTAYEIRGAVIALRSEEASKILVQLI